MSSFTSRYDATKAVDSSPNASVKMRVVPIGNHDPYESVPSQRARGWRELNGGKFELFAGQLLFMTDGRCE